MQFSILDSLKKNLLLLEGMFKNNDIEVVFEKVETTQIKNYENELTQAFLNIFYSHLNIFKIQYLLVTTSVV